MKYIASVVFAAALAAVPCRADHLTVPPGTEMSVRTNEQINSKTAQAGETFDAEFAEAVTAPGGQVVIPRGSAAQLVLREFETGGVTGSRELVLDLQSVSVDGRNYFVGASTEVQSGKEGLGKNRRTATYTGGGAALGALIGAIAGGGKGAAIGAAAGAGAGAATQVLTRGDKVQVPAETVLTFKTSEPLRLSTR